MAADTVPVLTGVLRGQRRPVLLWSVAVAAVTAIYVGFWPAMGDAGDIDAFIQNMPEGLVEALGYGDMGSPAGYLRATVYALLGPALLLVFAIGAGARLVAGQEEDGTLELELTAPVARLQVLVGRLLALWAAVTVLVAVLTVTTLALAALVDMDIGAWPIVAAGIGLLAFVLSMGTLAMAVGAATGRRSLALGAAAGVAVAAFVLDAIGPTVDAGWMTAISPFSWYIEPNPLVEGLDPAGLVALVGLTVIAAVAGAVAFDRRDLMV